MAYKTKLTKGIRLLILCCMVLGTPFAFGQEATADLSRSSTYHNQLFFNRFLINPTFSLVREHKSYLNILHRNQYATFENNIQNYFFGFSNRLNDHTALGIGVYSQWEGVIQEFGFNANYATSVNLGQNSKLTFGANVTYFNEGLDKNSVVTTENDPGILEAKKESKISIQPGVTLSLGRFDFGLFAENLFKFNQTTNEFLSQLNYKSLKAFLQYTHTFGTAKGLFKNARFMPLVQLGRNTDNTLAYLGSILLDLPNYGWFQTTIHDTYGLSMGIGFNLNKKMSLGYLLEKDYKQKDADFGWNHELSLAYTFKNDRAKASYSDERSADEKIDRIVRNYEEQILELTADKHKKEGSRLGTPQAKTLIKSEADTHSLAYENRLIIDELMLRQDSIEAARTAAFEKRFETIVRIVRNELKQNIRKTTQALINEKNTALVIPQIKPEPINRSASRPPKAHGRQSIKILNQTNLMGVKSGYYLIANVYKNKTYLTRFMNSLKEQGLNARKFYNRENELHYVYLADFKIEEDAKAAYVSNLNGRYQEEKWIMQVENSTATATTYYEN